ncbi:MAG: RND family transporter [Myxococcota bacterium]
MSLAERLAWAQTKHPWRVLAGAFVLLVIALPFALQIRLDGDFTALLPEGKQSVKDIEAIQERFGGKSTLTVMAQGPDIEELRSFVSALAPRIAELEDLGVLYVDWNVSDFIDFAEEHRFLYADLEDLEEISDALLSRYRYEYGKVNPFVVDLTDAEPPDPEEATRELKTKLEEAKKELARYPQGFFQHPEKNLIAMFVRTSAKGGEANTLETLLERIESMADDLADPGIEIFFGGDLMDVKEETEALERAVIYATVITLILVFASIYFFFRRVRAIPILGLSLLTPVVTTFAIAFALVEYLNASTAFLSTIVVGNGINPNVIWLSRYFEERRRGQSIRSAVARTHVSTWPATLTASAAAGFAYGSLIITEFRGFRDFGVIGGSGMALCWIAAYLVLPALAVLWERLRPVGTARDESDGATEAGGLYGVVFAFLASRYPRVVLLSSLVIAAVSGVVIAQAVSRNPMEYDFRNLQSERSTESRVQWVNDRQGEIVDETITGSSIAILLNSITDTSTVMAQLEAIAEKNPKAFGEIKTIRDLIPRRQEEKIEILEEMREVMPKLLEFAEEDQQRLLKDNTPPDDLEAITIHDLPVSVARLYRDREGKLGRVIYLEHHPDRNGWDGAYLREWAGAAREVRLGDGSRPPVVGQPPVFVDLLSAIFTDGPKAVGAAFLATILLVLFTFRRASERLLVVCSLLLGILWMAASMAGLGMKLNFLNFVAFPITFGNGVDYGVNVMRRYVEELGILGDRGAALVNAVHGTGGAVVLCSLTTIIGYISLYTSSNKALNSFGAAMAISEVTCVVAGVLVLPAALFLVFRQRTTERPQD